MAILIDENTRLMCQGLTGRTATYHLARMVAYGTKLVAGVVPGKGGRSHLDVPIFETVASAKSATAANASIVFVPPRNASAAMIEAIEAEIPVVVCVTERVPIFDMLRVRHALAGSNTSLVGPNSQGLLSPGSCQVGVMTTVASRPGSVGIVSRSASLTSEVMAQTTRLGLGQSTTVGVGGDPVHGVSLKEAVALFLDDPSTGSIVVVGEIGGAEEEELASFLMAVRPVKPIVALVVGRHAPRDKRMGHAGAFASLATGTAIEKNRVLEQSGVTVARDAASIGPTLAAALSAAALSRTAR
ncbi:MAG: succinate--CoA ligase subunit alpha [Hyphomicrobiaceae bacterium]|nr:succinate--CoA ligase subunit alpha [Hyphomicrobiaceae bacterium]